MATFIRNKHFIMEKFPIGKDDKVRFSAKISSDALIVTALYLDEVEVTKSSQLNFSKDLNAVEKLTDKMLKITLMGNVMVGDIDGIIRQTKINFNLSSGTEVMDFSPKILKVLPYLFVANLLVKFTKPNL